MPLISFMPTFPLQCTQYFNTSTHFTTPCTFLQFGHSHMCKSLEVASQPHD
eukprot:c41354_g1_i1 orf=2-151(-)